MRKQLGSRLPEFTAEEAALVKGSNDFYGMNHYCANYIKHKQGEPEPEDHAGNLEILMQNKDGEWIGPETQSVWLRPMPLGFRKLMKWLSDRYGGPTFYVTENGTSLKGESDLPLEKLLDDEFRCEYFRGYIGAMADAHAKDGVDVRGYSAWSLMEYVSLISSLPIISRYHYLRSVTNGPRDPFRSETLSNFSTIPVPICVQPSRHLFLALLVPMCDR